MSVDATLWRRWNPNIPSEECSARAGELSSIRLHPYEILESMRTPATLLLSRLRHSQNLPFISIVNDYSSSLFGGCNGRPHVFLPQNCFFLESRSFSTYRNYLLISPLKRPILLDLLASDHQQQHHRFSYRGRFSVIDACYVSFVLYLGWYGSCADFFTRAKQPKKIEINDRHRCCYWVFFRAFWC